MEPRLLLYGLSGREWSSTDVSVSLLPDGTSSEGYASSLYAELNAVAPQSTWQREFARALQTWANASNLNFHFVTDDGSPTGVSGLSQGDSRFGDIRLGAHPLSGYVAYAYYPSSTTKGGDITINPNYTFKIGTHIDLYSVLLHETGHALGLDHSTSGTIMYPTITGVYTSLMADDIAGVQAMYGARTADSYDAAGGNDSLASASSLALASGVLDVRADLTSLADVDYYRLDLPSGADGTLTVSVDARGTSLLAPRVSVFDALGNLLASADAQYGLSATLSLAGLTAGQSVYVMADGMAGDAFGMGAYRLNVQAGGVFEPLPEPQPPAPPEASTVADRFEVNDSFASASNLGKFNSQSQAGLSIHSSQDRDFYRFTVAKSGTFQVAALFAHSAGDLDLVVYNAQQQVLASSRSQTDDESVSLSLSSGQTYYVGVSSPTGSDNVYDLEISRTGGGNGKGGKGGRGHVEVAAGDGTDAVGFEVGGPHGAEGAARVPADDTLAASARWGIALADGSQDARVGETRTRHAPGEPVGADRVVEPNWGLASEAIASMAVPGDVRAVTMWLRQGETIDDAYEGDVDQELADALLESLARARVSAR